MLERHGKLIVTLFVLSLPASGLYAGDFYLGAGLSGDGEAGSFGDGLEGFATADGDPWKVFAGLRPGRHWAVEVGYRDFGTQRCCEGIADLGFTSEVDGFSAAVLGRWPLGPLTPFVKAGVLSWEEDGAFVTLIGTTRRSEDGTDLLVGAGIDLDLAAGFTVRADWERYEFDGASSDGFWASLLYRF